MQNPYGWFCTRRWGGAISVKIFIWVLYIDVENQWFPQDFCSTNRGFSKSMLVYTRVSCKILWILWDHPEKKNVSIIPGFDPEKWHIHVHFHHFRELQKRLMFGLDPFSLAKILWPSDLLRFFWCFMWWYVFFSDISCTSATISHSYHLFQSFCNTFRHLFGGLRNLWW